MARWGMAGAAAAVVAGAALVTGTASVPPPATGTTARAATIRGGSRTGYVNLPRVHREYRKAAKLAAEMDATRKHAREAVEELKGKYLSLQRQAVIADPARKEETAKQLAELARQIEDAAATGTKDATGKAEAALRELFGDIRAATAAAAKEGGFDAVHAYPGDPDTDKPAEMEYILKTPALAPLYLNPDADLTDRILKVLNDKFEAEGK